MKEHITDEKTGISYTLNGDYYIPDIALPDEENYHIGKYGLLRERFLKEHRVGTYTRLLMTDKLNFHLFEIDTLVHQRVDEIISSMAKADGTDETLKACEQMEWVGRMNNYRHCAEEIVFQEIIYI